MSYSFGTQASMSEDVGAAIDKAYEEDLAGFADKEGAKALLDEIIPTAKAIALEMLTAVARPEDEVSISISGHHNAGKEPTPGWRDCFMSVAVYQKPPKPEAS